MAVTPRNELEALYKAVCEAFDGQTTTVLTCKGMFEFQPARTKNVAFVRLIERLIEEDEDYN